MRLDWSACEVLEQTPGKLSGAWVFRGTRMPASIVLESFRDGLRVEEIARLYDGLTIEQIEGLLAFTARTLSALR